MYSCIAGFVDVGETLYDCLKREVAEEGGGAAQSDQQASKIAMHLRLKSGKRVAMRWHRTSSNGN